MYRCLRSVALIAGLLFVPTTVGAGQLHSAVQNDNFSAVQGLLDEGAAVDELDGSGKAPLHIAAERNNVQIIELLISGGADPDQIAEGFYGPSDAPIHFAIKRRSLDAIKALAKAGASLTLATTNSPAPLHLAIKSGRTEAAELLISLGAMSFQAPDVKDKIPEADVAAGKKFVGICKSCHSLEKNAPAKQEGLEGPPLWNILGSKKARYQQFEYSKVLLNRGGNWSYAELNSFIANPTAFLPGTKMSGTGTAVEDVERRVQIIAFLRTLSDAPIPLPE